MLSGFIETGNSRVSHTGFIRGYQSQQDSDILQPTCNNLCARMPAIVFLLARLNIDMATFWGESLFRAIVRKPILSWQKIPDIIVMNNMSGQFIQEI